ncbi:hypothetical protein CI109_100244 [Kwoniella shandongensis]|uniref:Uncharacterized protein n=1 Tax=Kwoniella shandongensis TaxID=1734106 RepID=A0A5M6BR91_9TREE|nr:uncharacterized protein CI109_006220 [Kwoniella shandongensis]KAA5525416.1 hypothetical protein CI109_006220 [Kwoniella shandongensis]
MSQPIPTQPQGQMKTQRSLSKSSPSPQLLTPAGTPPACDPATESRLHQLLAHFDAGTHQFCREDREGADERRMSLGSGVSDVFPTPPSSRRTSFLSSLSLTRPFSFTPSTPSTPLSASHPKDASVPAPFASGLSMTPADHATQVPRPTTLEGAHAQSKSTPNVLSSSTNKPFQLEKPIATTHVSGMGMGMTRSKTASATTTTAAVKQSGFTLDGFNPRGHGPLGRKSFGQEDGKRHFDPSRDPKLLGLL